MRRGGRNPRIRTVGVVGCLIALLALWLARPVPAGAERWESITVHGHWTIEVLDPDGTVVTRREFDNALEATGAELLAQIYGRQAIPGLWSVLTFLGCNTVACVITESRFIGSAPNIFKTLVVSVSGQDLVLTGTATARADESITVVRTRLFRCPATTAPSSCLGIAPDTLVTTAVIPEIPVTAGQVIRATVRLTFSS